MKMTLRQIDQDIKILKQILSGKLDNYTSKSDNELRNYYNQLVNYRKQHENEMDIPLTINH